MSSISLLLTNPTVSVNKVVNELKIVIFFQSDQHVSTILYVPKFIETVSDVDGILGSTCTLTCQVEGNPTPIVRFTHKNIDTTASERYTIDQVDNKYTFTIQNIEFEDEGEITVFATNSEGESHCSCELFVDDRMDTPTASLMG